MSARIDGGQAFPRAGFFGSYRDGSSESEGSTDGMTLLDYFAAHAPSEPQPWFKPDVEASPVEPQLPAGLWTDTEEILKSWRRDPCYDLETNDQIPPRDRAAANGYGESMRSFWDARSEWNEARERARYTQWPYAWAATQVKEGVNR